MFGLRGSELLLVLSVLVVPASMVLPIIGVINAALMPDTAWTAAGKSKAVWLVLQIASTFLCAPVGVVFALLYLFGIHPQVKAHKRPSPSSPPAGSA